jgi:GntR family transcriptional regulator, phosphonate transport system regulatory protein
VTGVTASRYLEIADELAGELAGLAPGTRLVGEHRIGQRFGVGRAAARAALQELERRLLVRRVQGAGTFVNRRIDYTISHDRRPSWHETVAAAGGRPRTVVREIEVLPLPAEQAGTLGRPVGTPCHRLVRQFYIDDLFAARVHEWVPVELVADLDLAMHAAESLDLVLRQVARVEPVRAWCRVSLDVPPPEVCAGLEVEPSRPVWLVESLSRDAASGRAVMCSRSWMRSDAVRVVVELGSNPEGE